MTTRFIVQTQLGLKRNSKDPKRERTRKTKGSPRGKLKFNTVKSLGCNKVHGRTRANLPETAIFSPQPDGGGGGNHGNGYRQHQ